MSINVLEKIDLTVAAAHTTKTLMGPIKYWLRHPINVLGFFDLAAAPVRIAQGTLETPRNTLTVAANLMGP